MTRVERVADTTAHTGEGSVWHPAEQRSCRVDIPAGRLYRYDPETGENAVAYETDGVPLGGVTVEADGALSLVTHGRVERLVPGEETTDVAVTVDAEGYLWSARWDGGRLVRYDPAGRPVGEVAFPARPRSPSLVRGARSCTPRPR
ncbi:MAG: gluconolactonase [uncultured archaeon A07HR67]|nr:MAG: gluconolactonase [uncultured archaeon A07HR67]